ncbi:MAG: discoidin domain-containing protein [Nocardioides sp.]|nr:discoidin domain-containing protein [Nocardioides sp.]
MTDVRRPARRAAIAGLASSLAAAVTTGIVLVSPPGHGAAPQPPRAHVWMTTADGSERLHDRGTVAFARGAASDQLTITVDPSLRYQTMDGFGASITDSSASVLNELDPATRDATMRDLFVTDGLSFLRQPIGSSDFVDGPHYTYDDMPPGQTDYTLAHFSIDHDKAETLPLLREARALNPDLKVMGTPWSPPAWMKTNDSLVGGRLIDDPQIYQAYADYLVKFVQAYQAAGVPIWGLTIQNEPQNRTPSAYPGTDLPTRQAIQVIDRLGPALAAAGLHTKIMGYDHNWSEHPNDVASTPPGEDPETEYPTLLLQSSAARWISGTAYHCYYGDQKRMTALHQAFPDKEIWFTECSGSHGPTDPPAQIFSDTLKWHARNLTLGVPRNWAQTVVTWNLALHPDGTPHNGGCDTCTGVVSVNPDGTVTRNAEYYTLGHLARFVKPGAVRVASSSYGSTGWNGLPMSAAFVNPDGSTALVVNNEYDDPRTIAISVGEHHLDYTLPGASLATFTWPVSADLTSGTRLIDPWTTSMTSNVGDPTTATAATDDDGSTPWTSGTAQAPGQWVQVDLGHLQRVRQVVLDAGPAAYGYPNDVLPSTDYPRGYRLSVSSDGSHWTVVRDGVGTGQLTTLKVPHNPIRYVRVTLTQADGHWWQVADVRVYG